MGRNALSWAITSDINDSKLFAGFYNDHREGKGTVNCVPIYLKHVEFDSKVFAEALCKVLNSFDVRDFRVIPTPSAETKKKRKEQDEKRAWATMY